MSWRWVTKSALLLLHDESLTMHGGRAGMRDEGLLDSALAKPLNVVAYADPEHRPDLATLAASYCFGLAKNQAFVDGNKRAAFLATGLFLHLNAHRLVATQADATQTMLGVAAGDVSEDAFATWLRQRVMPRAPAQP